MTKYNIATTLGLLICIVTLGWLITSPNFSCIKKSQKIVDKAIYDSLVAIANRPPTIRIDTIRDTIPGKPIIKWKDKLVPVYKDSLSTVYSDTLKTKNFKVVVNDTLQWNQLQYRKYTYETYMDTILKYVEKEKPVFVSKDVPIPQRGLYYGGFVNGYKQGGSFGGTIFLITKKEGYFGIQGGVHVNPNLSQLQPLVGFTFGHKF